MATNTLYDPSNNGQNSSKGAMIQANMYAWIAEGLGRVDISSAPNVRFEYEEMQRKDKTRIINPLAHIQFATGLRPVRAIFSEGGARYTNKDKTVFESVSFPSYSGDLSGNPYGEYLIETVNVGTNADSTPSDGVKVAHSKYLLKPKIDSMNLIPQLVSDVSSVAPSTFANSDADTKAEFIRNSYFNFVVGADGGTVVGKCNGSTDLNTSDDAIFYVYDTNNYGDDGSLNVIASFKIYAKYNDDGYTTTSTSYWPQSLAAPGAAAESAGVSAVSSSTGTGNDDKAYLIDGMPITTFKREVVDVSFIFPLQNYYLSNPNATDVSRNDGLKLVNTDNTDVSYVGILMHGNVSGFKFKTDSGAGGIGDNVANNRQVSGPPNGFICSKLKQSTWAGTRDDFITAAKATAHSLDFSFTGLTLEDTDILNLNDDNWAGDLILPLTGDAVGNTTAGSRGLWDAGTQPAGPNVDKDLRDAGGLQCIHIPDSIRTLRNDAAQSLAANFAGLSELLGSVNITAEPDISMGEFNSLAFNPLRDASTNAADDGATIDGPAGSEQGAHGVFTIKGDILINKLRNFMLGSNYEADSGGNAGPYTETGNGFAKQALDENERRQHIHKVVYWSTGTTADDISKACLARDTNQAVPDAPGGIFTQTGGVAWATTNPGFQSPSTGAFLTELTPQESSFFYIYPWASTEMCAISSGSKIGARNIVNTGGGYDDGKPDGSTPWEASSGAVEDRGMTLDATAINANDFRCNPFRQYQDEYVGGVGYNDAMNFDSLSIAVPTVKGWLDNRHGYYNTTKKRTEWYAFADICGNNNHNSVQINDISYVYQALGPAPTGGLSVEHDSGMQSDGKFPTGHAVKPNGAGIAKGAVDKSVLDIVFPDVTKKDGTLLDDIVTNQDPPAGEGGDYADDDFCTLNFRVPLQAVQNNSQKRLQKVSNLHNGVVQLANESHVLNSGFTAKVNASADNLSAIAANVNELMNSYCPVIIRLMDEDTIGVPGHTNGTVVAPVSETRTVA